MYPPELLDALGTLPATTYDGQAWRITFDSQEPVRANTGAIYPVLTRRRRSGAVVRLPQRRPSPRTVIRSLQQCETLSWLLPHGFHLFERPVGGRELSRRSAQRFDCRLCREGVHERPGRAR
jgi:hypothetical protein